MLDLKISSMKPWTWRGDPAVRSRRPGIRYLLIDEFQIPITASRHCERWMTGRRPHFFVGDVKQPCLLFPGGADIFNGSGENAGILDAPGYSAPPGVLHFVNDFFHRTELLNAVETYQSMGVRRKAGNAPCVEYFLPRVEGKEKASRMRERDAEFIANRILELCDTSEPLQIIDEKSGDTRDATYDDVVLLFRRSSYMYEYESALRERHIPYNRVSGAGFFQRREIQDILALLQLILDPWNEEALVTVLRSPLAGLSDESLMRMAQRSGGIAAVFHSEDCPEFFEQAGDLDQVRRLFKEFYARRESEPGHFLRQVLDHTGFEAVLLGQHLGLQHAANLRKVIQMADAFSRSRPSTLAEFTRYLEDVTFRELKEGESTLQSKGMGAVTLMSIHKAKGLEFPIVFLPEAFAKDNPGGREVLLHHKHFGIAAKTTDDDGMLQPGVFYEAINRFRQHNEKMENARVLYVAMTRARDYLILCGHPFPNRYTWADTFNRAYDLTNDSSEKVMEGPEWRLRVNRSLPETVPARLSHQEARTLDRETLEKQIRPVNGEEPGDGRVVSVTRLLSRMTGILMPKGRRNRRHAARAMRRHSRLTGGIPASAFLFISCLSAGILPKTGLRIRTSWYRMPDWNGPDAAAV